MADAKSEAAKALQEHGNSIDALHQKLAAMPGVNEGRLSAAVAKYKSAHEAFQDDALECIGS
jgi:hypothetical protein